MGDTTTGGWIDERNLYPFLVILAELAGCKHEDVVDRAGEIANSFRRQVESAAEDEYYIEAEYSLGQSDEIGIRLLLEAGTGVVEPSVTADAALSSRIDLAMEICNGFILTPHF